MTGNHANVEPIERAEVRTIFHAYDRLRKLGWRDAFYAPRDSSALLLIEAGSTGIHRGYRDEHGFWVADGGDTYPSHPILWKALKRAVDTVGKPPRVMRPKRRTQAGERI